MVQKISEEERQIILKNIKDMEKRVLKKIKRRMDKLSRDPELKRQTEEEFDGTNVAA